MLERMYDKQLAICTELNTLRRRYFSTLRIFRALSTERKLKHEIEKLKIIEDIRKEMETHAHSILSAGQNAYLKKFNQSFDKKIS